MHNTMKRPNIIFIFADDMQQGDVGCYNPESRIPTPNMDKLSEQGIRFVDAHAASAFARHHGMHYSRDAIAAELRYVPGCFLTMKNL